MRVSVKQLRAARSLKGWQQVDLAEHAGVSVATIKNIETEKFTPNQDTLEKVIAAYELAGIEFIEGGVREANSSVQRYYGTEGLITLMDDTYKVASTIGGDICLYNAKPENWLDYLTVDWFKMHAARMMAVKDNFNMRILVEEGNTKLISSFYAIHRWFPKELFISENESLYVYGDKLGFVNFGEENVEILILHSKQFSAGVRALFDVSWKHVGIMPPCGEKLGNVDFSEWETGDKKP